MISKTGLTGGTLGVVIFVGLYGPYVLFTDTTVPHFVAGVVAGIIFLAAGLAAEVIIARLEAADGSQDL